MIEVFDPSMLVEQIRQIIKSKNWYSLTESGRFLWQRSVELMAEMIESEIGPVSPEQIREIIESSFGPDFLSRAGDEFFIDCLLKIDPDTTLWSEGDLEWQKIKATKTGLLDRSGLRPELIAKEKTAALKDIILSLVDQFGEKVCVIVIDDKEKNLAHAISLQDELAEHGILIKTFQINLTDVKSNPAACLKFISTIQEKNIRVVVDMDGVLVDTDRVLSQVVPPKLAETLTS